MLLRTVEYCLFGTAIRECILVTLLRLHYASRFRRNWYWTEQLPRFSDGRIGAFNFSYGAKPGAAHDLYRAFLSAEIIRKGDRLLDIGCGDGFFDKRFFAGQCEIVDAIDVDPGAIRAASADNSAPNIRFHLTNAVEEPFPAGKYDVIVWDAAIGHCSQDATHKVLKKIAASLNDEGIFVGSESLGYEEPHNHLQFFESLEDLHSLLRQYFRFVRLRVQTYEAGVGSTFVRREAFWRCANDPVRIEESQWQTLEVKANVS
jgi:SAM-dependent methyltransferase